MNTHEANRRAAARKYAAALRAAAAAADQYAQQCARDQIEVAEGDSIASVSMRTLAKMLEREADTGHHLIGTAGEGA